MHNTSRMSQQETHFLSNKGVSLFSNLEGPSLHFLSPLFPLPFSLPPPLPSSVSYVLKLPFCPCTTFPSIQLRNLEDLSMPAYSTSCSTSSMASVSSKLMTNLAYQPLNSRCKTCFGGVDMYTAVLTCTRTLASQRSFREGNAWKQRSHC